MVVTQVGGIIKQSFQDAPHQLPSAMAWLAGLNSLSRWAICSGLTESCGLFLKPVIFATRSTWQGRERSMGVTVVPIPYFLHNTLFSFVKSTLGWVSILESGSGNTGSEEPIH